MNSKACARKARVRIKSKTRRRLARHSNFACSICGAIPIVFHHIENWSGRHSNNDKYLIPICDKCHRGIHGEGGSLFSKKELYRDKNEPIRPLVLRDRLPLDRKQSYSFFIGSNFIDHGNKTAIFKVSGRNDLISIDMSEGIFKLNILAGAKGGKKLYLIKENELIIDSQDIWDMKYSRNALNIRRSSGTQKTIFIDLIIEPEIIIIRKMNTTFNGVPFRIYKLRKPYPKQIEKIKNIVKTFEEHYKEISRGIDSSPDTGRIIQGIDLDLAIKEAKKSLVESQIKNLLYFEIPKNFKKWKWSYYLWVLNKVLNTSKIFSKHQRSAGTLPDEIKKMNEYVIQIKKKYKQYFQNLEDVIVEFDGKSMLGNIQVPTI